MQAHSVTLPPPPFPPIPPRQVQQQTQKFVDAAGNVYDVLTDSLGQATKFIVSSTGAILDSTQVVGGFFLDSFASYPGEVKDALAEGRQDAREYASAGVQALQQFGQIAQDARPQLPPFKQMLNPGAWKDAAKQSGQNVVGAFGQLENQLMSVFDDVEAEFCKPAVFKPSMKKPTEIKMPGFYLEVGLGNCTAAFSEEPDSHLEHADAFSCTKPYVEMKHVPGKFTAKHHTPFEFKSKECMKETLFGEDEELVLFQFDGHDSLDLNRVRDTISDALGGLSQAGDALTNQVQSFVTGMKEIPANLQGKLGGLSGLLKYQVPAAY